MFEKVIQDTPILYTLAALIIGSILFHIYKKFINKPAIKYINNTKA